MKAEAGFTLIEAVMAGILSAILAGVALSVFTMNNTQVNQSRSKYLLASYYNALSQDIQRTARRAYLIKVPGDPGSATPVSDPFFSGSARIGNAADVVMCDALGDTLGGFRIATALGNRVQRLSRGGVPPAWQWDFYAFGEDTLAVGGMSNFNVYSGRRGLFFQLNLSMKVGGKMDGLTALDETESAVCRNGRQ